MGFATDLLSGLTGFRDHLVSLAVDEAKPALAAVEAHIARLLPIVHTNVLAAEEECKAILHELYGSLVGAVKPEPVPTPPAAGSTPPASTASATIPAPAPADPTPAPSTTPGASSASTETAPAAPTV